MQSTTRLARFTAITAAVGLSALLVGGTAAPLAHAQRAGSTLFLNGAGSTFIQPLMTKWAFQYSSSAGKGVRINYQGIGSGAGIKQFQAGTVDFAGSDAFLSDDQLKTSPDALHIPLTIGPVAVIYNLPGLSKALQLDGPTLALIYQGKITTWNDKAIAALNAGVSLPSTPIVTAHRADGSGTSFIFTNYLSTVSAEWKSAIGASTLVNWPGGQGAKGTSGVAQVVKQTPGGIGYAELSYATANNLPVVAIKNKAGKFIAPSIEGASAAAAGAGTLPADLRALIVDTAGDKTYPISGFTWAIIHQKAPNNGKYAEVLKFLWWAVHTGQSYSSSGSLRYAALPANIVKADEAKIKSVTYNGKPLFTGS